MRDRATWYDEAEWYDLAFSWDPAAELDFLAWAFRTHASRPVRTLLEPGCGSGHYLIPLRRRYRVVGFDLNAHMVRLCNRKAREAGVAVPAVHRGDFSRFSLRRPVDAAYMLIDTIRHLTTARALRSHFRCMHRAVAPGGVYVLGFDLAAPEAAAAPAGCAPWTMTSPGRRVTCRVRSYRPPDLRRRQDFVESILACVEEGRTFTIRSRYRMRWLSWEDFAGLAALGRDWECRWATTLAYRRDAAIDPARRAGDVVLVLRRLPGA